MKKSKAPIKLLKTRNLDCAAMLTAKGIQLVKFKKIGAADVLWQFDDTKEIRTLITKFQQGKVEINLPNYLYNRVTLKRMANHEPTPVISTNGGSNLMIKPGMPYFFLDGGEIKYSTYGFKNPVHQQRATAGNFYMSKGQAMLALQNKDINPAL